MITMESRVFLDTKSADQVDEGLSKAEWVLVAPVTTPNPTYTMNVRLCNALLPTAFQKIGDERQNNRLTFVYYDMDDEDITDSGNVVRRCCERGQYSTIELTGWLDHLEPERLETLLGDLIAKAWSPSKARTLFRATRAEEDDIEIRQSLDIQMLRYKPWPFLDRNRGTFHFAMRDWLARDLDNEAKPIAKSSVTEKYDINIDLTMMQQNKKVTFKLLTREDVRKHGLRPYVDNSDVDLATILGFSPARETHWFSTAQEDPYGEFVENADIVLKSVPSRRDFVKNVAQPVLAMVTDTSITITNAINLFKIELRTYGDIVWKDITLELLNNDNKLADYNTITIRDLVPDTTYEVLVYVGLPLSQLKFGDAAKPWWYTGNPDFFDPDDGLQPEPFLSTKITTTANHLLTWKLSDINEPDKVPDILTVSTIRPGIFGILRADRAADLSGTKYIKILTNLGVNNVDPHTKAFRNVLAVVPVASDGSDLVTWFSSGASVDFPLRSSKLDKIQIWLEDDKSNPISMHNDWLIELGVRMDEPETVDVYKGISDYTGAAVDFHAAGDPGRYKRLYDETNIIYQVLDHEERENTVKRNQRVRRR